MRLGILTSVDIRHRYFVQELRARFDVVAVAYEETGYSPATSTEHDLSEEERQVVSGHFAERDRQEALFFGHNSAFVTDSESCRARHLVAGTLNTDDTLAFLEAGNTDTVVVYGTNLVKAPLLDRWPGRMINMHLGLSPYYRGTATNFYPLLNEEPEYVGATIHLLDFTIDGGPIFAHARPEIVADDMPHTIGCKAITAGIEKLIAVLRDIEDGRATRVPQWQVDGTRLYLRKDYHPRQVVDLYRKIEAGLIPRYVERAARVAGRIRLIE
ncbi:MAG: hypothetical protein JSU63_15235 [Phycisphaerales bacterium]|nr:MAG: hypothetical protein JSU63_15235 [Phycisphaerales bacterium]